MARKVIHHGGRRSGWPPERSDQALHRAFGSDDIVLTILWAVVIAGLVLLIAISLSASLGWDVSLFGDTQPAALATASGDDRQSTDVGAISVRTPVASGEQQVLPDSPEPASSEPAVLASTLFGPGDATDALSATPLVDVSASVYVTIGRVLDGTLHSNILDRDLPYRIYLPPGYGETDRRFPVLYLLHGNGEGLYTEWTSNDGIGITADALIADHKIEPMIIVMPDGEHSYFMNHYGDGERWEDYTVDEVIPFMDSHFLTLPEKQYRAIGGLSMGGTGALSIAFSHPELFAAVGGHSPALRASTEEGPEYFGPDWYYAAYNPLELAKVAPGLSSLKVWVDYGDEDPWLVDGAALEPDLQARSIDYEWHIYSGNHWVSYWMDHSPEYLQFYSDAFAAGKSDPGHRAA